MPTQPFSIPTVPRRRPPSPWRNKQIDSINRYCLLAGRPLTTASFLPQADASPEPAAIPVERAGADGHGVCALVVEDNDQVGEFATQALRELGYDSVLAPDAKTAIDHLTQTPERFHVVFSDVVMPGMTGIELGHHIRRSHPSLPIVLASGFSHVLADNGAEGFELIGKPYSVDPLLSAIKKALRPANDAGSNENDSHR